MRDTRSRLRHGKLAAKLASQLSVTATDKTTVANLLVLRLTFYILCHSLLFFQKGVVHGQSANAQRARPALGTSQDTASIVLVVKRERRHAAKIEHLRAPLCLPSRSVHCASPPRREEAARAIPRRRRRHDRLVLASHRGEHLRSKQVRSTKKRALSRSL